MLSFLLSLNKKHGRYILTTTSSLFAVCIGIWGFDVQNIFPSGALPPLQKWVFRLILTLLSMAVYFATLFFLTAYFLKKDTDPDIAQRLIAAQKKSAELQPKKTEPFFYANLLWLPNEPNPYCPSCYGQDKKLIHMLTESFPESMDDNNRVITKTIYSCASPKCNHRADIVPHP